MLRRHASAGGMVLAFYAGIILVAATFMPWWRMENRAPQYGMRVLTLDVSPLGVVGDTKEIDGLGHYVGMKSMLELARLERAAAPWLVGFVTLLCLALPFMRPGRLRLAAGIAVAVVPLGFIGDLWYWQQYAVNNLDPTAALNKIADRIQSQLVGNYVVAQFKVHATFQEGFWLALVSSANIAAFLVVERRRRGAAATAPATPAPARASSAILLAACILAATAGPAAAQVLEVGPAAPYRTIGDAVAAAAPGAEILVHAGVYRERILADKPLTLRTDARAVIDGGGSGTVVHVTKGPTTIRGFAVRGSGMSLLDEDAGIRIWEASDCAVIDNDVDDALFGILVRSASRARIAGNRVRGKILPPERQGDGIQLNGADDSEILENTVSQSRDLSIWQSHRCVVRRNHVSGCRYGLHYMYCDDHVFEDNVFTDNQTAGAIMYTRRLTLRGNRFSGSRGPSAHGLLIKVGDDVTVERNVFTDNTRGVFIEDSPSSLRSGLWLRANLIGGNDVGVALQPTVARVVFSGNAFIGNRVQVEALGSTRKDLNLWSENGRGNFWSDHVGFDRDGDGIGDTPYRIEQFFENLADRWPAVGLLRLGPAVEALETAARAFPVVKPRPAVTDPHPLMSPGAALGEPARPGARPGLLAFGAASVAVAGIALFRARREGLTTTP